MPKRNQQRKLRTTTPTNASELRIIGGSHRGRKIAYLGDPKTRPMKDRVREAVFNLLGPAIRGRHVIDLFAGTGALALEALSRGAAHAIAIDRHFPTIRLLEQSARAVGLDADVDAISSDTFYWARRFRATHPQPLVVFCSPPYAFYVERKEEMFAMLGQLAQECPRGTLFVIESDRQFRLETLAGMMTLRQKKDYPPARVGIFENVAEQVESCEVCE